MKRWLTHSLVVLAVVIASCDFNPINSAVDDFAIVVGLEPIETVVGMGFYDYDTGQPISAPTKIVFRGETAEYIVDIFSDRIDSMVVNGGFSNIGIHNSVMPTGDSPLLIAMDISADGYLSQRTSISISDTGFSTLNFDLFSSANLPENISISTNTAPLDNDGNALPMPFPFDTTSGDPLFITPDLALKAANSGIQLPYPMLLTDIPSPTVLGDQSFNIHPTSIEVTARSWTNNPDFITEGYRYPGFGFGFSKELVKYRVLFSANIEINYADPLFNAGNGIQHALLDPFLKDGYAYALGILGFNFGNANDLIRLASRNATGFKKFHHDFGPQNGRIAEESAIDIGGRLELWDWFSGGHIREAKSGEQFYTLYTDSTNSADFFQNFYFASVAPENVSDGNNTFQPFYSFPEFFVLSEIPSGELIFDILGTENYSVDILHITIKSEGYILQRKMYKNSSTGLFRTFSDSDDDIPFANARVTVTGNGIDYSTIIDFTDLSNGSTVVIDLPAPSANAIDTQISATLSCKSPNKFLRVDNLPNTTFIYKKAGENTRYQHIPLQSENWEYDEVNKVLKGASFTINNVDQGADYEYFIQIENERQPGGNQTELLNITSPKISKVIEIPDDYCQD